MIARKSREQIALMRRAGRVVAEMHDVCVRASVAGATTADLDRAARDVIERRGARSDRVAILGPVTVEQHAALSAKFGKLKSLNRDYVRLRQVKSPEELDWLRIGAHFSDLGMAALRDGLKPGLNERELGDLVERAYISYGAANVIHYIGVTSMQAPDLGVPRQFPRMRQVQSGDVVVAEITAA